MDAVGVDADVEVVGAEVVGAEVVGVEVGVELTGATVVGTVACAVGRCNNGGVGGTTESNSRDSSRSIVSRR